LINYILGTTIENNKYDKNIYFHTKIF